MPTLYEKVGGQSTIATLISAFYQRVFADPVLGPFFVETSLEKLTHMQEQFFTIALGGPGPDDKICLRSAHQGRGIEAIHLTRFTDHLLNTLKDVGVDEDDAKDIVQRISEYSHDILGPNG